MSDTLLYLVCSACGSVNRIPSAKRGDQPKCGNCKELLLPGRPVELTADTFSKFIQRTDLLVVVDFWAPWCGPCRMMAPQFAKAAGQLTPDVVLAKLNTDEAPAIANRFDISGIPCLIAFRHGREVARHSGVMDAGQIANWAREI